MMACSFSCIPTPNLIHSSWHDAQTDRQTNKRPCHCITCTFIQYMDTALCCFPSKFTFLHLRIFSQLRHTFQFNPTLWNSVTDPKQNTNSISHQMHQICIMYIGRQEILILSIKLAIYFLISLFYHSNWQQNRTFACKFLIKYWKFAAEIVIFQKSKLLPNVRIKTIILNTFQNFLWADFVGHTLVIIASRCLLRRLGENDVMV